MAFASGYVEYASSAIHYLLRNRVKLNIVIITFCLTCILLRISWSLALKSLLISSNQHKTLFLNQQRSVIMWASVSHNIFFRETFPRQDDAIEISKIIATQQQVQIKNEALHTHRFNKWIIIELQINQQRIGTFVCKIYTNRTRVLSIMNKASGSIYH